jgi:hypothetical protein
LLVGGRKIRRDHPERQPGRRMRQCFTHPARGVFAQRGNRQFLVALDPSGRFLRLIVDPPDLINGLVGQIGRQPGLLRFQPGELLRRLIRKFLRFVKRAIGLGDRVADAGGALDKKSVFPPAAGI